MSACCCCDAAIDRLVLVAELVRIELEQVGEILRVGLLVPATTTALASRNLILLERRLGPLQVLEGTLLGRKRVGGVASEQLFFGDLHLLRGLRQLLRDDLEGRVDRRDVALHHAAHERLDRFADAPLREVERREVLAQLVRRRRLAIAIDLERAGDDLALAFGQLARDRRHLRRHRQPPSACLYVWSNGLTLMK